MKKLAKMKGTDWSCHRQQHNCWSDKQHTEQRPTPVSCFDQVLLRRTMSRFEQGHRCLLQTRFQVRVVADNNFFFFFIQENSHRDYKALLQGRLG